MMKKHSGNLTGKIIAALPLLVLAGIAVFSVILPDKEISKKERRHYQMMPELSVQSVLDGSYMAKLEDYLKDQIAGREAFRTARAELETGIFRKTDTDGYYRLEDDIFQTETAFSEKNVVRAAEKFSVIAETYFPQAESYVAVIPDKNHYVPVELGYPVLDYKRIENIMQEHMPHTAYISLEERLDLQDYYRTDLHWRQESIGDVADLLLDAMVEEDGRKTPEMEKNSVKLASTDFLGGYAGASAFCVEPEKLCYVVNESIDQATVYDYEKQKAVEVYAWEKLEEGTDFYDFFLWGARALLTIENPEAEGSLILFRDSFGSSIAPLLMKAYGKITLVDLRYVSMDYAAQLLEDMDYDDVLFLYSGSMLNRSNSMRL